MNKRMVSFHLLSGATRRFLHCKLEYMESPTAHHEAPHSNLLVFYMEYGTQ